MGDLNVQQVDGAVVLRVKVVPGSSKTAITGILDGALKVKVSAPAEKGRANSCLVEFLAKKLKVKSNAISIISGQSAAVKQLRIAGLSQDDLLSLIRSTGRQQKQC